MSRCLILSNRLPLTFNPEDQNFFPSSGGLVSAIRGINPELIKYEFTWLGLITDDIDQNIAEKLKDMSISGIKISPIIVAKKSYDNFYNRYSNNVLWPLFHYERNLVNFSHQGWESYVEINQIVADHICHFANESDVIWVHDFHFFLVPGLIKEKRPELKIGFFLHIPFPSSEIFRELPQRKEILESLLKSNLIGFHDLSYLNHFKNSISRILGKSLKDFSETKCGVYPISIDSQHFINLAKDNRTKKILTQFQKKKEKTTWILGVDRLDYIKGLVLKIKTFREFLKRNPKWVGQIQLVQIVIPSRTEVQEYKNLKEKLEQLISSINGEFGTPLYTPVLYLYHSVDEYELSALYQVSEILYVGSRRDGMNLVCLEYVISQEENSEGQIILSEFAGAHSTLSYAYSINPWNIEDTCQKISLALISSQESKRFKIKEMRHFLLNYTSSDWAQLFLKDLEKICIPNSASLNVSKDSLFQWLDHINKKRVLIFCDLDGTLTPISNHPSEVKLQAVTKKILFELTSLPLVDFIVVSGRDRSFLQKEFIENNLHLNLAACHGSVIYSKESKKWTDLSSEDATDWRKHVFDILKIYVTRTPHSFIEDKEHAIVWHYRNSPGTFSDFLSNKLVSELESGLIGHPVQINRGKKIIEVKSLSANKGKFTKYWLSQLPDTNKPDVVIALGDDSTDEDMFKFLQEQNNVSSYCIKIGEGETSAHYTIRDQSFVNSFLEKIVSQTSSP
jgi:trehalose 6-phosphate synthase/phosphatase